MKYCISCGQQLPDNAKFCSSCGNKTKINSENTLGKSGDSVFEGNIHKCPNCGEVLKSFSSNCPLCGHEIRDAGASNAVKELASKLEEIEKIRPREKSRFLFFGRPTTETDEKKISLIQSFPIPNTKEDLHEFFILSKSNIDIDAYNSIHILNRGSARISISNAWKSKFEQAYEKSKIIFSEEKEKLLEIQKLYNNTEKAIKKEKHRVFKMILLPPSIVIMLFTSLLFTIGFSNHRDAKKQINRLIQIENDINENIEDHDYQLALMNASNLQCEESYLDKTTKREWKNKQEYYIEKIISEAEKEGVELTNPLKDSFPRLEWKENKFTELIPKPNSEYGKVDYEYKNSFAVTIYNITDAEYEKYKQNCIENGFEDVDFDGGTLFIALDDYQNKITINYKSSDDKMKITVDLPIENK